MQDAKPEMSAAECMMGVMDGFSEDEPLECIIVYRTESGMTKYRTNGIKVETAVGMLEICKLSLAQQVVADTDY